MRNRWLALVGGLFTVGSLYLAFRGTNFSEVLTSLKDVGLLWVFPVLGGTMLSIWIRAYRWKVMLGPVKEIPTSKTYVATMIGFMANNVLPMRLGELVRAYSIGRSSGISKSTAFATIVVERAFDLFAVLLFLGVMLLRHSFSTWVRVAGFTAVGVCVAMFLVMGLFHWKREATVRGFGRLTQRLPRSISLRAEELLQRFLDGLEVLSKGHHLVWIAVLSVLTWVAMATGFYFCGLAFGLDLPWDASIVMVVVCSLAVMLPSGPGFVGTFEVGARYGLAIFKVPENLAISYALFYHAVQFAPITLFGLYHLWRENFSLKSAVKDQENPEDAAVPEANDR